MLAMLLWFAMFLFFIRLGFAADIKTAWDASAGGLLATKSKLALTWELPGRSPGMQANSTTFTWDGAPDTGLLLFRAAAYNQSQEVIRYEAGAWYNGSWKPPANPTGLGLK